MAFSALSSSISLPICNSLLSPTQKKNSTAKLKPAAERQSLLAALFKSADHLINTYIDPPRKPNMDPKNLLAGNFAPVGELPPTECSVIEGALPSSLDGAYIRNGPNPQFFPRGPYHHFDGDGMLHAITISDGKAIFCSRFVKTYKYKVEKEKGQSVLHGIFSGFTNFQGAIARGALLAARIIAGEYNLGNGIGSANTSLALIAGKLYALGESDLPYEVRIGSDGEIHTLYRHNFAGRLSLSMTAHPKTDPETGETFSFRYWPIKPFLTFFRINSDGEKQPDVPILSLNDLRFLHDFAISQKYAVFNENQIIVNPIGILKGDAMVAASAGKVPRIGIIPRYATDESEMRWFETESLNFIHFTNAWDEDDGNVVVILAPNILTIEHLIQDINLVQTSMEMVKIDLRRGTVVRRPLFMNLEFTVINPAFVGRKNRYVYAGTGDVMPKMTGVWPKVSRVVKLDISLSEDDGRDCVVGSRNFGPSCFAGEPIFVHRSLEKPNTSEDDGYLIVYVHDEITGESRFLVMDAKSPELDIIAVVQLPQRVPYGFHGLFVPQRDLKNL